MGEGAALKLGVAARTLAGTAAAIARDGRVGQLPVLHTDAELLVERAERLVAILDEQERAGQVPPRAARAPEPEEAGAGSPSGTATASALPPPDAPAPPDARSGGGVAEGTLPRLAPSGAYREGAGAPSAPSTPSPTNTSAPAPSTPLTAPVLAPAGAPGGATAYPPSLK